MDVIPSLAHKTMFHLFNTFSLLQSFLKSELLCNSRMTAPSSEGAFVKSVLILSTHNKGKTILSF